MQSRRDLFDLECQKRFDDYILNFKNKIQNDKVSNADMYHILVENPQLQALFRGEKLNFGTESLPYLCALSQEDRTDIFKIVLPKLQLDTFFAEQLWNSNPEFKAWFSGRPFNSPLDDFFISDDNLIANFEKAVASHIQSIIKEMWAVNSRLHRTIKNLPHAKAKELLLDILMSVESSDTRGYFVNQYLNWLDESNIPLIEDTLVTLRARTTIKNTAVRIKLLEQCLKRLNTNGETMIETDVIRGNPHRKGTKTFISDEEKIIRDAKTANSFFWKVKRITPESSTSSPTLPKNLGGAKNRATRAKPQHDNTFYWDLTPKSESKQANRKKSKSNGVPALLPNESVAISETQETISEGNRNTQDLETSLNELREFISPEVTTQTATTQTNLAPPTLYGHGFDAPYQTFESQVPPLFAQREIDDDYHKDLFV